MIFSVLDVKCPNMVFIAVQVTDVIQALEDEMGGIVQNMHAWMIACCLQEAFKSDTVMQVFARVNFVGQVNAIFFSLIEQWQPAFGQFLKAQLYQPGRSLGPGIHSMPEKCTREGGHDLQSKVVRCLHGFDHLIHCPRRAFLGVCMQFFGRKGVELYIVSRMYCDELADKMRCQFSDCQSITSSLEVITILF